MDSSQKELKDALLKICPVPVTFQPIKGEAHGFYRRDTKEIVVDSTLSEKQSLKTLIHEMGHAMLHSTDIPDAPGDVSTREVQAESVAYVLKQKMKEYMVIQVLLRQEKFLHIITMIHMTDGTMRKKRFTNATDTPTITGMKLDII